MTRRAEGVMDEWRTDSFSMTRFYCDCLEPEHALDICVERDSFGDVVQVSVEVHMNRDLPWKDRLRMIWDAVCNRRVLLCETIIQVRDWEGFASAVDCILKAKETTTTL